MFDLRSIGVYDISNAAADKLIGSLSGYSIKKCTLEEAVASDIVCTLTPSREPVIKREWVVAGTHINAVGADAAGKEELEPSILKEAIVVVDDIRQASSAGEINVPISRGTYAIDEVYATLGEIVNGKKEGRTDYGAITVFDSTGVAIEDIAVAKLIYEKAKRSGSCPLVNLVEDL